MPHVFTTFSRSLYRSNNQIQTLAKMCSTTATNSNAIPLERPKWGYPFSEYEKNGGIAKAPPTKGRQYRRMRARHRVRRPNHQRRKAETAYAKEIKRENNEKLRRELRKRELAYRQAVAEIAAEERTKIEAAEK